MAQYGAQGGAGWVSMYCPQDRTHTTRLDKVKLIRGYAVAKDATDDIFRGSATGIRVKSMWLK